MDIAKMVESQTLWSVWHNHFATDHYDLRPTLVSAQTAAAAMKKLNDYLATNPNGIYTAEPCTTIEHVYRTKFLE